LTQVLMFIPLQLLYELSVWIAWYWEQPDRSAARRKIILGLLVIVLVAWLAWLGWVYGWPWLHSHWS
jgi:hypothetical protein